MQLLSRCLHEPVHRLRFSANIHSRGTPTAFEKMAVVLVKQCRESEELRNQSIPSLFEMLVGNREADFFIEKTLENLFSPAIGILRVDANIDFKSYDNLPVSEIEILPNGEELLSTGQFPTRPRTVTFVVLYHPLAQSVENDDYDELEEQPSPPEGALPDGSAGEVWPEELLQQFVLNHKKLRPGEVVAEIMPNNDARNEKVWKPLPATVELENGVLTAKSNVAWAERYLNGLTQESFRNLLLRPLQHVSPTDSGPARDLSMLDDTDIYPPTGNPPLSDSWIHLHPDSLGSERHTGVRLEVIWHSPGQEAPDGPAFQTGRDRSPDRLVIPGRAYPDSWGEGDLRSFSHIVQGRAVFAHSPLEIPVGVRERLSDEATKVLALSLITALLETKDVRAIAHAACLADEIGQLDTGALREQIGALTENQRKTFKELLNSWNAVKVADAVLPHSSHCPPCAEPLLSSTQASPKSQKSHRRPLVSYSFEPGSARRFRGFFQGQSPTPDCEFVMARKLVAMLSEEFATGKRSSLPSKPARNSIDAFINCPFLVRASMPRDFRGNLTDEILQIALHRHWGKSVIVTDDRQVRDEARRLHVHTMSCKEFARRIKAGELSKPINGDQS